MVAPEHVNPESFVVRVAREFVESWSMTGQVSECSVAKIHHRSQPEWSDGEAEYKLRSRE